MFRDFNAGFRDELYVTVQNKLVRVPTVLPSSPFCRICAGFLHHVSRLAFPSSGQH